MNCPIFVVEICLYFYIYFSSFEFLTNSKSQSSLEFLFFTNVFMLSSTASAKSICASSILDRSRILDMRCIEHSTVRTFTERVPTNCLILKLKQSVICLTSASSSRSALRYSCMSCLLSVTVCLSVMRCSRSLRHFLVLLKQSKNTIRNRTCSSFYLQPWPSSSSQTCLMSLYTCFWFLSKVRSPTNSLMEQLQASHTSVNSQKVRASLFESPSSMPCCSIQSGSFASHFLAMGLSSPNLSWLHWMQSIRKSDYLVQMEQSRWGVLANPGLQTSLLVFPHYLQIARRHLLHWCSQSISRTLKDLSQTSHALAVPRLAEGSNFQNTLVVILSINKLYQHLQELSSLACRFASMAIVQIRLALSHIYPALILYLLDLIRDLLIIAMQTATYLERVGDRNRFQIYSAIFVCLKWLVVSLTVFLPSYLLVTPTFTCGDQLKVFEKDACSRIKDCKIDFPHTITAHMNLYCDDKYIRDSILSAEFVGSVTGLILLSILADRLGRKVIIVSTIYLTCMGAICKLIFNLVLTIGAETKTLALLYIGQVLMGFGGYSLSMVSYSFLSEVNNDVWRQKSLVLTYAFWALGEIMLYPIIRWLRNWSDICLYVFIVPLLILLVMSFFICETPEFYYVHKKYDECLESLNFIARFNGKQQLRTIQPPAIGEEKEAEKITDTFTKRKFLIPLIVLSFAQVCNNGLYYATQYSIAQLGQSFEVNMLIIGILEVISCLVTNYYCDKMYRKRWIMIFMVLSGSIGLLMQFATAKSEFEIALIAISRLFNTFGFALFSLITTESFPTSIRSTGTGITEAMSNLGNMSAPFLVTLGDEVGVKGVFISGIVCIAGGLSMTCVKQTKKGAEVENNPLLEQEERDEERIEGDKNATTETSTKQN